LINRLAERDALKEYGPTPLDKIDLEEYLNKKGCLPPQVRTGSGRERPSEFRIGQEFLSRRIISGRPP